MKATNAITNTHVHTQLHHASKFYQRNHMHTILYAIQKSIKKYAKKPTYSDTNHAKEILKKPHALRSTCQKILSAVPKQLAVSALFVFSSQASIAQINAGSGYGQIYTPISSSKYQQVSNSEISNAPNAGTVNQSKVAGYSGYNNAHQSYYQSKLSSSNNYNAEYERARLQQKQAQAQLSGTTSMASTAASEKMQSIVAAATKSTYPNGIYANKVSATNSVFLNKNDALSLKSNVALIIDEDANQVLYEKNTHAVLPIASITKLMTALVVLDARLPLEEKITVSEADVDRIKGSSSKLRVGDALSRQEMLLLALMASENRAAASLSRYYPGGRPAFVSAMNRKAQELGMRSTFYEDSTGLSKNNVSSAYDLGRLVHFASQNQLMRTFSTHPQYSTYNKLGGLIHASNTNFFVKQGWDIGLQKTGYISEAGKCMVMQAKIMGRSVIMVFLDAANSAGRINDVTRIRDWLEGKLNT